MTFHNSENNDKQLIKRVLQGETNAFRFIISNHREHLAKVIAKYVPKEKIEELSHEAFIKIFQSLAKFSAKGEFRNWLSKIAVRTCLDYWKTEYKNNDRYWSLDALNEEQKNWVGATINQQSEEIFDWNTLQKEAIEILDSAFKVLTAEERMIINMVYIDGMKFKEMSECLTCGESKVKMMALRSKQKLKKYFEENLK